MSPELNRAGDAWILVEKFPRIARFLEVERTGWISARLPYWDLWERGRLSPVDRSAAYEEWADFYQWHLEQRADELAGDRLQHRIVEQWTDEMVYMCRRCAAYARGENPGEWIPAWERRPDLAAERRAFVERTTAGPDDRHDGAAAPQLVGARVA